MAKKKKKREFIVGQDSDAAPAEAAQQQETRRQAAPSDSTAEPAVTSQPQTELDPSYNSWAFYGKVYAGCFAVALIIYLTFLFIMRSTSGEHLDEAIALYDRAMELKAKGEPTVESALEELKALDAIVDIEEMRLFILSDVMKAQSVPAKTKGRLKFYIETFEELRDGLKAVQLTSPIQLKIRDHQLPKIQEVIDGLHEVLDNADMQDREKYQNLVNRYSWKLDDLYWNVRVGGGFLSWPVALDVAEACAFESLRFWRENPEAARYWGLILEALGLPDVGSEKKVMSIKFDPKSEESDVLLAEFKKKFDEDSKSPGNVYYYAFALYRKGRLQEALPLYEQMVKEDPTSQTWYGYLAKRRLRIINEKIDPRWSKTDDF